MIKVVYSFAPAHGDHGPSPIARAALERFAPQAEIYELGRHTEAYFDLFSQLWADGEGWLNIEQDIEIYEHLIEGFEQCPEPWCIAPYGGAGHDDGDRLLYGSLGCTRFSTKLIQDHPSFIAGLQARSWQQLDAHILPGLRGLGYERHYHWPAVKHHHLRQYGMTKRCDCRTDHD